MRGRLLALSVLLVVTTCSSLTACSSGAGTGAVSASGAGSEGAGAEGAATSSPSVAGTPMASTGGEATVEGGPGGIGALPSVLVSGSPVPTSTAIDPSPPGAPAVPAATSTLLAASQDVMVSTPSRNIGCALLATQVRCDVLSRAWPDPPKPPGCDFDYGSSVYVGVTGPGQLGCVSDTVAGSSDVLDYGVAIRRGDFVLTSTQAGVHCRNARTGHGFTLARERYLLF